MRPNEAENGYMLLLANGITFSRMILVVALIFVKPLSIMFFAIYLICGISDILDGYVARKTATESRLGAKLDSLADLMMVAVVGVRLYPCIAPILQVEVMVWIGAIGLVRLLSLFIVRSKFKTFSLLHTYGNKATGFFLFVFPFFLLSVHADVFVYFLCLVASLSSLEELWIHLSSRELQIKKKSLFLD